MYTSVLAFHILFVMLLFGVSAATDAVLSRIKRNPTESETLVTLLKERFLKLELVAGLGALFLGIALVMVNPAGPKIFTTGGWIHAKVTCGLLGILVILCSRVGMGNFPAAKWVQPVRGIGMVLIILTVLSAKVLRGM